ncbi:MAG: bifunctional alpha/beta hydrolase/OsmC family protein [Gammaproteobacteria bacterium]
MPARQVRFPGSQGGALAAVLETPPGAPRGYALFAHCFTCTKDIFSARYLTSELAGRGYAVLRFDFTGLGASEGEFENTNFSSNVSDLLCAAEYLRAEHEAPSLMVGHSLGGAAVLSAAGDIPELRAVATVGAPAEPAHVRHLFTDAEAKIEEDGEAEVLLAGRPFRIKKQFLEDIEGARLAQRIAGMNKALLVMHSVADKTVEIENARKIYEAAKHPKSFVSLDRADHLLSDKRDAVYAAGVLAAWAERYLPAPAAAEDFADKSADEQTVIAAESGNNGIAQKIYCGKHEMVADEPSDLGGANAGPTPYGYLLAALGACTTMTLRLYAARKNIPLKRASAALRHEKIHSADCAECESGGAKIDAIERAITLEGDLTEEQRAALLAVADKCPVHKTLQGAAKINTRLQD